MAHLLIRLILLLVCIIPTLLEVNPRDVRLLVGPLGRSVIIS